MKQSFITETKYNPWHIVLSLWTRGLLDFLPDKVFLKLVYRGMLNKKLNLKQPQYFNEKLQWLKIHDRKQIYSTMVDKYEAKQYVATKIGGEYIIPTYGVWDRFDDIDFEKLPNKFVLKCTHDSGGLIICKDKKSFDMVRAREKINKCLSYNFFQYGREWPYKNVKPRIIAEKYMEDSTGELRDYKLFCFNGKVRCLKVDFDRFVHHQANYFDENNSLMPFGEVSCPPSFDKDLQLPVQIEKMKELASCLSVGVPFMRCDFYDVLGKIYFGEITFYPASGFGKFTSDEFDRLLGEWISIPED